MAHPSKPKSFFSSLLLALFFLLMVTTSLVSLPPALALTREGSIPAQNIPNSGAPYVAENPNSKWALLVGRSGGNTIFAVIDKNSKTVYKYINRDCFSWGWLRDAKGVIIHDDRIIIFVVNVGTNTVIGAVDYWPITNPGGSAFYTISVSDQPTNVYIPWAYPFNNKAYAFIATDTGKLYVASFNPSNYALEVKQNRDLSVAQSTTAIKGWWDSAVNYHVLAIRKYNGDWSIALYNSDSNSWRDIATIPGVNADPFYSQLHMFTDSNDTSKRIYLWGYVQPIVENSVRKFQVGVVKLVLNINTLETVSYSHDYTVVAGELPGGDTPAWAWAESVTPNYFSFLIPGYDSVDLTTYVSRGVVLIANSQGSDPATINLAGFATAEEYGFNMLSYSSSVYINENNGWVWEYNNGAFYAFTGAQQFTLPIVHSIQFLTEEIGIPGSSIDIEVNATGGPLSIVTKYYVNGSLAYQWVYLKEFASPWEAVRLPYIKHFENDTPATIQYTVEVYYSGILLATASKSYQVYVDLVLVWEDYAEDNYVTVNVTLVIWDRIRNIPYWKYIPIHVEIRYWDIKTLVADYYTFQESDYTPNGTYFHQFTLPPGYYYAVFNYTDPYTGEEAVYVSDMFKVYDENGWIPPPITSSTTPGSGDGGQPTGPLLGDWGFPIGDTLTSMVTLIIVLVIILAPAIILSKEAGLKATGFYAGALIGLIVGTVAGLVPWYLAIFGVIAILLLMWWGK